MPQRPIPSMGNGGRAAGFAAVMALHLVLIAALLHLEPARRTLNSVAPLVVSLIAPEVMPPPPQAPPPRAKTLRPTALVEQTVTPPETSSEVSESPITPAVPEVQRTAPEAVYAVESVPPPIIPPRFNADYLQNPAPTYPALSRRMREQGRVLLRVLVNAEGLPERIELKTSSGSTRLDQSALETVRHWKFVPARQGEQKIAAWVVVPVAFALDG